MTAALRRDRLIWVACLAGREPAESLTTAGRAHLVALLHLRGWSDLDIAELTHLSTYTTARIRVRLGLAANRPAVALCTVLAAQVDPDAPRSERLGWTEPFGGAA